jgi:hypothetical protein
MDDRWVMDRERIRKITGSFSWIDHRFVSGGFLPDLSRDEILIYLFLVVNDRLNRATVNSSHVQAHNCMKW